MLLERFARRDLDRLDDEALDALEHLLGQPDQDILEWLVSAVAVPPDSLRRIVTRIRVRALGRP